MTNMTVERALEISTLEEGKRKPAPNILSDAIETLLADEGNDHGEAVHRIQDILNGKRKKKAPEAPKAVASTKAPVKETTEKKKRAPRVRKPKEEAPKQAVRETVAPPKETRKKDTHEPRLIPQGKDLVQFFPGKVGDLHDATVENPYRVFMFMEEENEKGEAIVTIFRVLFYSDKQKKVVLFDESTQKGATLTAEPKEFLFKRGLFRDLVNKEDFHVEFAVHTPQEK